MTDLDLARTALTTAIHHPGVAYRVQILSISQNEGLKLEDNYLDIKVYDNVISQIGNIQIGNVQSSNDSKKKIIITLTIYLLYLRRFPRGTA